MMRSQIRSRRRANARTSLLLPTFALMILCASGCSPGIQWRAYAYNPEAVAREAGERTRFVYFRHWAVPACTRFEESVLLDPQVLSATKPYYCIVLAYNVDKRLADEWGVSEPPGVALLGPNGRLLASGSGTMSKDQLLALFKRASEQLGAPSTTPSRGR